MTEFEAQNEGSDISIITIASYIKDFVDPVGRNIKDTHLFLENYSKP